MKTIHPPGSAHLSAAGERVQVARPSGAEGDRPDWNRNRGSDLGTILSPGRWPSPDTPVKAGSPWGALSPWVHQVGKAPETHSDM